MVGHSMGGIVMKKLSLSLLLPLHRLQFELLIES